MKYAWWIIFFIAIFLFCTQRVAAAEIAGFDPTAQYVVHSTPLVVVDPAPLVPDTLVQPSLSIQSDQSNADVIVNDQTEQQSFLSKVSQEISSLISKIKEAI